MSDAPARPRHTRSPSYPAINLERAVERARELFAAERQYATPVETAATHWGYAGISGPSSGVLAALKKFGLLEDEGSKTDRRVRITDLAVKILQHPVEFTRAEGIRQAALLPTAHQDLWAKYGPELPSDRTLLWELTRERGFSESGAAEFVKEYRETLDYADLLNTTVLTAPPPSDNDHGDDLDEEPEASEAFRRSVAAGAATIERLRGEGRLNASIPAGISGRPSRPRMPSYQIPLLGGGQVSFEGPFPLTEQQWDFMLTVLSAMKPGLIEEAVPGQTSGTTHTTAQGFTGPA